MSNIQTETLDAELAGLNPKAPFALLPVKLQTRFADAGMVSALESGKPMPEPTEASPVELWVRIYPDDIFVHTHEEELTEDEFDAAKRYWSTLYENRNDSGREHIQEGAWRSLAEDYGPVRARYVLQETKPEGVDGIADFPASEPVLEMGNLATDSWNKAARTYLLPTRFIVSLQRGGQRSQFAGNPIQKTDDGALILGLDPNGQDDFADEASGLRMPEAIRWMADFSKAVEIGMGIRIPLEAWAPGEEIQSLLVLGWNPGFTKEDFSQLLANHRYKVGGMDLAPVGVPTNNTREADAQIGPEDLKPEDSLPKTEGDADPAARTDTTLLEQALGLGQGFLSGLHSEASTSIQDARLVHRLLFDATIGNALDFWLPGTAGQIKNSLRDHFCEWVSGRGHLPALRIDDQPYGFLPALPLSQIIDNDPFPEEPFLRTLWKDVLWPLHHWYSSKLAEVPHLERGISPREAQLRLLAILQLHPTSAAYRYRFAVRKDAIAEGTVADLFKVDLSGGPKAPRSEEELAKLMEQLPESLKDIENFEALLYEKQARPILYVKVETDEEDGEKNQLVEGADEDVVVGLQGAAIPPLENKEVNYLQWLSEQSQSFLQNKPQEPAGEKPYALLYHLLRYRLTVFDWEEGGGETPYGSTQEQLERIAAIPPVELKRMVQEHLDCCTYRLDAWLGSYAAKRLHNMREQDGQAGLQLGAWGYVEHLRPRGSTLQQAEYIPAPSLRHASAAAVLRSGFQSNRSSGSGENMFAVDLSAGRVKDALFILEGVRNGQDLSAVLGYRLERSMQEYRDSTGVPALARYIQDLRERYRFAVIPLVANEQESAPETEEDQSQHVIDALRLLDEAPDWKGVVTNPEDQDALQPFLNRLAEQLDSVRDLLAAEGVYQLVDGQTDRAKAALDAMTDGEQPTRPEIVDQPRSSLPLSLRMGVILQHSPLPVTGGAPLSPRAVVGSKINRWLFDKLPDLSFIKVRVQWQEENGAEAPTTRQHTLPLRHLLIEPIDLVYMMHLQRENPDTSELQYRIERVVRQQQGLPITTRVQVLERDRTGFDASDYTLFAVEPLAAGLGKLLLETRSLRPEDFLTANDEAAEQVGQFWAPEFLRRQLRVVVMEMEKNEQLLQTALEKAEATLAQTPASAEEALAYEQEIANRIERLQELTFYYAGLGWVKAVPVAIERLDQLTLDQEIRRCRNILEDARARMAQAQDAWSGSQSQPLSGLLQQPPTIDGADAARETELLEEITALLFGRFYRIYPDFRLPNPTAVAQSLADDRLQHSMQDFAVERWIQTQAPLRPKMDLYYRADMLAELFGGTKERAGYQLLQLPFRDGTSGPWVGQEYGDFVPHGDTMAMTLELQTDFDLDDATFSGLLVDEWQELIPEPEATTGIALQYDQPDTEAPNVVLLGMTLSEENKWDWDTLQRVVLDNLHLAKLRAVDPDLLRNSYLDQVLPAVLGPVYTSEESEKTSLKFGPMPDEPRTILQEPGLDLSEEDLNGADLGNIVNLNPEDDA